MQLKYILYSNYIYNYRFTLHRLDSPAFEPKGSDHKKMWLYILWGLHLQKMESPFHKYTEYNIGAIVVVIVWWLDLQRPVLSVPITAKVVSSNPAHGEVYSIQHYVIKFVSDMRQVSGFFHHDTTEILLKVMLNTVKFDY